MPVIEDARCKCGKGRFIYPNKWWRDTLKHLRCTWCGEVKMFSVLQDEVKRRMRVQPPKERPKK